MTEPATHSSRPLDWPPDLLSVADLTSSALGELLDLAGRMKAEPAGWGNAIPGQSLACFFDPPTTGLVVAVATAAQRLGMQPVVLPGDELRIGSGEPIGDMARAMSASAAALLVHSFRQTMLKDVARAATVPVINALSDEHSPCQALADLFTLRERFGGLEGLALAYVGDAGVGVAHSLLEGGALAAMDLRIACPPEYRPSDLVLRGAEIFASLHGGRVTVTEDVEEAVAGADAVYTSPWVPPDRQAEREERRERLRRYRVHPGLMTLAKHRAVFMHCLPASRGDEVSEHVMDGDRSMVWEQAANRVPTEQAIIYALVTAARAEG
jgi:ornithine carbamoyltransferase